jgi:acyl-ACP thioesterase
VNCDAANPKGTGIVSIWQENHPVRFGAIDKSDKLTLSAVFRFFQEAAISHAENLGVGRKEMMRAGQVWVLSRMSVVVDRRPDYCESIIVRTWPRGGEKLFAIRDYDIRDKDDIPVITARSSWLVVDIERRRPLRPQSFMENLPFNEGINALASGTAALAECGNLQKTAEKKALYNDVDFNGHVNNVRYIEWIEDSLDPQLLENAGKMRLDINYLNEILYGEVIEIMSASLPDSSVKETGAFAFEGRKTETGQAAFRAELRLF